MKNSLFGQGLIIDAGNYAKDCKELQDSAEDMCHQRIDTFEKWVCNSIALLHCHMKNQYEVNKVAMEALNDISEVMERLPKRREYSKVKRDVKDIRKRALKTLLPIQKKLREAQENERKAAEMDAYG